MAKRKLAVSRNKKKTWIKHIKGEDVDEYLKEVRQDEITGGAASEKPNEKLFFFDNTADKEVSPGTDTKRYKPLRCFQILQNESQVKSPVIPNKQSKASKPSKRKLIRNKNLAKVETKHRPRMTESVVNSIETYDLWSLGVEKQEEPKLLDDELDNYYKVQTCLKGRKVPDSISVKNTALPAVEVPEPGASYNPTHEDHQDLLRKAHEVEFQKLKEEQRLNRVLTPKFHTVNGPPTLESWLWEMSQGIIEDNGNNSDEEDLADCPLSINPPVRSDRKKPISKRRKEKARRKMEVEMRKKKLKALKEKDVHRIDKIQADILEQERKIQVRQFKKRIQNQIKKAYLPAKIGSLKYEAPDIEITLPSQLTGSLRTMQAEGSILNDRYKSFQRRNVLEPRVKQIFKRKFKLKRYTKNGHGNVK